MQMLLLQKPSQDWWRVQLQNGGRVGLVPAKFVQTVVTRPGVGGALPPPAASVTPSPAASGLTAGAATAAEQPTTLRTQKVQKEAAGAVGSHDIQSNPVAALAHQLAAGAHAWTPSAGDAVEGLVGANWVRCSVVAPDPSAAGAYSVVLEDKSPATASKVC
jgi:hypothetical protein